INVNVSVAVTASHPTATSTPVVISRTMSPPHVPFGLKDARPRQNIPKNPLDPVTHVTGATAFASAQSGKKKPYRVEARHLRAAPDFSKLWPQLGPISTALFPIPQGGGLPARSGPLYPGLPDESRNRFPCDGGTLARGRGEWGIE